GGALVLAAESLRTSGVEIYGAAKGLGPQTMREVYGQVVTWAQSGELTFDVVEVPLSDIETAWQRTDLRGSRLVVVPCPAGPIGGREGGSRPVTGADGFLRSALPSVPAPLPPPAPDALIGWRPSTGRRY